MNLMLLVEDIIEPKWQSCPNQISVVPQLWPILINLVEMSAIKVKTCNVPRIKTESSDINI